MPTCRNPKPSSSVTKFPNIREPVHMVCTGHVTNLRQSQGRSSTVAQYALFRASRQRLHSTCDDHTVISPNGIRSLKAATLPLPKLFVSLHTGTVHRLRQHPKLPETHATPSNLRAHGPRPGAARGTWLPVVSEYCTQGQLSVMVMKCEGALPSLLFQQRTYASCSAISGLPGKLERHTVCLGSWGRIGCIQQRMESSSLCSYN